jgi:molybdopterin-guanine dinucleotide biosynthesis protein A
MSSGPADMIVLAGGRSQRMQGPDKLAEQVGGTPIVARVVAACASAANVQQVIVAAGPGERSIELRSEQLSSLPANARGRVQLVVDDPTLDGPVAGLSAALAAATAAIVVVIAGDMPFLTARSLEQLARALLDDDADAAWVAMAVDGDGRRQFACCAWRRDRLVELLAAERYTRDSQHGRGRGIALKALVAPAEARGHLRLVALEDAATLLDVDEPADLTRARARAHDVSRHAD